MLALSLPKGPSLLSDAQLSIPKTLATNSRVSITSKQIEIKGLQVLYSGHLRKTGGRGSYRLVHATHLVVQKKAAQLSLGIPAPTRPPGEGVYRSPGQTAPASPFPTSLTQNQGEGVWLRRISFCRGWARPALLGCVVAAPAADGRFSQVRSHRR